MTVPLTAAASTAFGGEQNEFYLTLICRARIQPDTGLSSLLKTGRSQCFGGAATAVFRRCFGSLTRIGFTDFGIYRNNPVCIIWLSKLFIVI